MPVRFLPREPLTPQDKLLRACDALVLAGATSQAPPFGTILHGRASAIAKLPWDVWMASAQAVVDTIATHHATSTPPPLGWNKHWAACELPGRCRQTARETDELSLLARMTDQEIKTQHSTGMFAVTQRSSTCRARRKPQRCVAKAAPDAHALTALAIRERTRHLAGTPALPIQGTPVYVDVAGIPERDLYYLLGRRVKSRDAYVHHAWWAHDRSEAPQIWAALLHTVAPIDRPQLIS